MDKLLNQSIFLAISFAISLYGYFRTYCTDSNKSQNENPNNKLVGSNVSVFSVALSVCSTFISAISILGFPSEIYFRGTMMIYYLLMYCISFTICAYVFLPVFYNLKLTSLYEYLERRFCFTSRILGSSVFAIQTLLYESAALYAPALALTSLFQIKANLSIPITALISAVYLFMGGARAGIYTSSLQMVIILASLLLICFSSLIYWDFSTLINNASNGKRLIFNDFRLDPRIRHSVFALVIGGSGNIFSLFGTNQLTLQRYMSLPSLKKAQQVLLLNIPMNGMILILYVLLGLIIYGVFHGCHPDEKANKIVTYFLSTKLNWIPGLDGIFMAALYSAGVSTLTASYNALTAITIEDVIKTIVSKKTRNNSVMQLNENTQMFLIKALPFVFAWIATILALFLDKFDAIILQIAMSIFGSAGGTILGIFCVGLFCPWITSNVAAVGAHLASIFVAILLVVGSFINNVTPINLPTANTCSNDTSNLIFELDDTYGTVTSTKNYSEIWSILSEVSYQYYSIIGVLVVFIVSHLIQLIVCIVRNDWKYKKVNSNLLASFVRPSESPSPK